MKIRPSIVLPACFMICHLASARLHASIVVDGGFETPYTYDVYDNGREAGEVVGAWTVDSGTVDLVNSTDLTPFEGTQTLDISGIGVGRISQTLVTTPGVTYQLTFQLAGNVNGILLASDPEPIKQLQVIWNNVVMDTVSFDVTGRTRELMGWELRTYSFTAVGANSTLSFASLNDQVYGPVMDDVIVNPVPEPEAGLLAGGLGLVAFALWRRRRA